MSEGESGQVPLPVDGERGQEPAASDPQGQEPEGEGQGESQEGEPKTFAEEYVKDLRKQAATARSRATKAETELKQLEDSRKTDTERLVEGKKDAERRAEEAELKLIRFEVAAERQLDLKAASFLAGSTREEVEEKADELVRLLASQGKAAPSSFDGGVRQTPQEIQSPEQAHNLLLLKAAGRLPE
jgi:hypothetical protein